MTTYDLKLIRTLPMAKRARIWSWIATFLFAFAIGGSALSVMHVSSDHLWGNSLSLAWLGSILFVTGAFGLVFVLSLPQATIMAVDMDKVSFRYSWRAPRVMKFDDPHFHLLTMKGVDKSIRDLTHASVYIVFGLAPVRTYVTQAAYAELLAKARTLGLRVEEKHYRQPEWTYVTIGAG